MWTQVQDFLDESEALYRLLGAVDPARLREPTQFKGWTGNCVLRHLHFWNHMVGLAQSRAEAFSATLSALMAHPQGMRSFEARFLGGLEGAPLLRTWRETVGHLADQFSAADPRQRLPWAGPAMSARSAMTARLMETWAHGQELYDHLGVERVDTDRIRNIAHLGVSTFGWSYQVRGLTPPPAPPWVRLEGPSGAVWQWNTPDEGNRVSGSATDFCQVVTQTRNVLDTALQVVGPTAAQWMALAQCFAGPPQPPPAPGTRFRRTPGPAGEGQGP